MRKFILGVLCGIVIFAGTSAAYGAAKSALIGKKVDGVMAVMVNGKPLDKDAVLIEDTSYLPVRAMTDAIGGRVISVKDGEIVLVTEDPAVVIDEELLKREMKIKSDINMSKELIKQAQFRISLTQKQIDDGQDLILTGGGTIPFKESDVYERFMAEIEAHEAEIARLESEIAALEAELADLQGK